MAEIKMSAGHVNAFHLFTLRLLGGAFVLDQIHDAVVECLGETLTYRTLSVELPGLSEEFRGELAKRGNGARVPHLAFKQIVRAAALWSPTLPLCATCGMPAMQMDDGNPVLIAAGTRCVYCDEGVYVVPAGAKPILNWVTGQLVPADTVEDRATIPGVVLPLADEALAVRAHPNLLVLLGRHGVSATQFAYYLRAGSHALGTYHAPLRVLQFLQTLGELADHGNAAIEAQVLAAKEFRGAVTAEAPRPAAPATAPSARLGSVDLTALRRALCQYYPETSGAAAIAQQAGLNLARLNTSVSGEVFWFEAVREAQAQGLLAALIDRVRQSYKLFPVSYAIDYTKPLSPADHAYIREALLFAFRTRGDIMILAQDAGLDRQAFADNKNLRDLMFDVVEYASTHNQLADLIAEAKRSNPGGTRNKL